MDCDLSNNIINNLSNNNWDKMSSVFGVKLAPRNLPGLWRCPGNHQLLCESSFLSKSFR